MAKDIFDVNLGAPIAWKLDGLLMNFGDHNNDLLATNCQLNYSRNLTTTFPINTDQRIIIAGTPKGTLSIGSIIGPVGDLKAFLAQFADICKIAENVVSIRPGGIKPCEDNAHYKNLKFTLTGCLISTFGLNVENRDGMGMVSSQVNMDFIGLQADNTN